MNLRALPALTLAALLSGCGRYRISDESVTTLLGGGGYRIGTLEISSSGEITFNGTRNSDGIPTIGNLSTGSTEVQALTENAPEVIQIARID